MKKIIAILTIQLFVFTIIANNNEVIKKQDFNKINSCTLAITSSIPDITKKQINAIKKKNHSIEELKTIDSIYEYLNGSKIKEKWKNSKKIQKNQSAMNKAVKSLETPARIWIFFKILFKKIWAIIAKSIFLAAIIGFSIWGLSSASISAALPAITLAVLISIIIAASLLLILNILTLARHCFDSWESLSSRKQTNNNINEKKLLPKIMTILDIIRVSITGSFILFIPILLYFVIAGLVPLTTTYFLYTMLFLSITIIILLISNTLPLWFKHYNMIQKERTLEGTTSFISSIKGIFSSKKRIRSAVNTGAHLLTKEERDDSQYDGYRRIVLYRGEIELLKYTKLKDKIKNHKIFAGQVYAIPQKFYDKDKKIGLKFFIGFGIALTIITIITIITLTLLNLFNIINLYFVLIAGGIVSALLGLICIIWYIKYIQTKYTLIAKYLTNSNLETIEPKEENFISTLFNSKKEKEIKQLLKNENIPALSDISSSFEHKNYEKLLKHFLSKKNNKQINKKIIASIFLNLVYQKRIEQKEAAQEDLFFSYSKNNQISQPAIRKLKKLLLAEKYQKQEIDNLFKNEINHIKDSDLTNCLKTFHENAANLYA